MDSSPVPTHSRKLYLITGGHGFLGSHVARRLYAQVNHRIRIVDIAPRASLPDTISHEFICGDLRDPTLCRFVIRGVDTVLHFAANMGGMGTIHTDNDFILYNDNHKMTDNILQAALSAGVKQFFYASSACIYPEKLQSNVSDDISLRESQAWAHPPPKPQGLYGLEKLNTELLLYQFASTMDIRIARFHNVFGPGGAWNDGREKAPAAMIRKAWALKTFGNLEAHFEIWGNGQQRRSFLFIDDAVDGVLKLLDSPYNLPLNIGSDVPITIQDLANIALTCAGLDPSIITFSYDTSKPVGVASRNSNNEQVKALLGWTPTIPLFEGMKRTSDWIREQIDDLSWKSSDQVDVMQGLFASKLLHLQSQKIAFAILLPITSRGGSKPSDCLLHLRRFSQSLLKTTWRDTHDWSDGVQFHFVIYLAIDEDDDFLLVSGQEYNKAEQVLQEEGIFDVETVLCNHPRGHVCKLWRDCARAAWASGCDYMVLMGDDVILQDEGWMRDAHSAFNRLADGTGVPVGFGCVAFTDTSFPGMPTFPIIHRTHLDIFHGEVVPDIFINQDGDPFLFQLYRRWGCSIMFTPRLSNSVGGGGTARYTKHHAQYWTFDALDNATSRVEAWLQDRRCLAERKLTLDVIIPSYRVDLGTLNTILSLKPSASCTTMFIIIVDNPSSPFIPQLETLYSHRPDVRIRVNQTNLGASASRNRGLEESAAEWVHFLDDDIIPDVYLLKNAEEIIRAHPKAAGFVGTSIFPPANSIFTAAVHLAGVTYFWDIARKMPGSDDVPWGVTANLIARRNVKDGIKFDLSYPKTGGGEDIHFCRMKREFSIRTHGEGFVAAPNVLVTHPWWDSGSRTYWRFFGWSFGDGGLIKNFPEHVYIDFAPNSAELMLVCGLSANLGIAFAQWGLLFACFKAFFAVVLANILHDYYRHLYKHPERNLAILTGINVRSLSWIMAVTESSFIRMFSEIGRLQGLITRGEYLLIGRRFDWFTGRGGTGPVMEERINNVQRTILSGVIAIFFLLVL